MGHAFTMARMLMGFYIDEITFGVVFVLKLSSRCPVVKPALTCFQGLKCIKMIIILYSYILNENIYKNLVLFQSEKCKPIHNTNAEML